MMDVDYEMGIITVIHLVFCFQYPLFLGGGGNGFDILAQLFVLVTAHVGLFFSVSYQCLFCLFFDTAVGLCHRLFCFSCNG